MRPFYGKTQYYGRMHAVMSFSNDGKKISIWGRNVILFFAKAVRNVRTTNMETKINYDVHENVIVIIYLSYRVVFSSIIIHTPGSQDYFFFHAQLS